MTMYWFIDAHYNIGDGWLFDARLDLQGGMTLVVLGSYDVTVSPQNWLVDVTLENGAGVPLAIPHSRRDRVCAKEVPGLLEAILKEDDYKKALLGEEPS